MTPLVKVPGFPVMTREHLDALATLGAAVAGLGTLWPPLTVPLTAGVPPIQLRGWPR